MGSKPCQLYDETGMPIVGKSASWENIHRRGLLHAGAHVWCWHRGVSGLEVLVQKRADIKKTYPGKLDISAAGHVDSNETPLQAAVREIAEELGVKVDPSQLEFVFKYHSRQPAGDVLIENEWKFVYLLELRSDTSLKLQASEVASTYWRHIEQFTTELLEEPKAGKYVYQGEGYFEKLLAVLESK